MSAPSTEHAKAHAEEAAKAPEAKAAPAEKPAEGKKHGVDGSIGDLLSSIGEAAVRVAQVPGKVHHERAAAAHAAEAHAKEHEKKTAEGKAEGEHGDGHHKKAEKRGDLSRIMDDGMHIYEKWKKDDVEAKDVTDLVDGVLDWADIEWARPLLIPVRWGLTKILGAREKIEDYEMDYKNIGDRVLKLNDKTLKPFLKRVKKDGLDDMENEIGDLLSVDRVKEEAKYNPDDLRAQITNLFNVKGNVTKAKLEERVRRMKERLKNDKDVGDPKLTKTRNEFVTNILDKALASLSSPGVLEKLYPAAEDSAAKFEWTEESYKNFGTTVLTTVNPKNRAEALKSFDPIEFDETFDLLYPSFDKALLDNPTKKKRIKEQVTTLFNVSVPFTQKNLERKKVAILGRLGVVLAKAAIPAVPAVPATATTPATPAIPAVPAIVAHPLETRLTAIVEALKDPELAKLFEDGAWTDANNFAAIFTEAIDYDIPGYIKNYNSGEFRAHFHYLFEMDVPGGLDAVISDGTSEDKEDAKEQIRAFAKQDNGNVSRARILSRIDAYKLQMNKADALLKKTAGYKDLKKDIEEIETNLTDARLNKLFKPVKGPEVRVINYVEFGKTLDSLENANQANAFLRGYKSFAFQKAFRSLTDAASCDEAISTELGRQAALTQLQTLLALGPGIVTGSMIKAIIGELLSHFDAAAVEAAGLKTKLDALKEDLEKVETTLVGNDSPSDSKPSAAKRLKVLLNGPEKKTIYDNFISAVLANKEQVLKEFDGLAFDVKYSYLIQDTFTATASPEEKGKAQAEVEKFFGQKVGKGEAKAKVQSLKKAFEGIKQEVNSAKGFAARQIFERLEQIEQGIEAKIENIYAA